MLRPSYDLRVRQKPVLDSVIPSLGIERLGRMCALPLDRAPKCLSGGDSLRVLKLVPDAARIDNEALAYVEFVGEAKRRRQLVRGNYDDANTRPSTTRETGSAGTVDRYHHRPHSRLGYKTPYEVKETWEDLQDIAA